MSISKVVIDPHYEEKHKSSVDDQVILHLVAQLDGGEFEPEDQSGPFQYFVSDRMEFKGKLYRLIWLLEQDQIYIGIVNAYRR